MSAWRCAYERTMILTYLKRTVDFFTNVIGDYYEGIFMTPSNLEWYNTFEALSDRRAALSASRVLNDKICKIGNVEKLIDKKLTCLQGAITLECNTIAAIKLELEGLSGEGARAVCLTNLDLHRARYTQLNDRQRQLSTLSKSISKGRSVMAISEDYVSVGDYMDITDHTLWSTDFIPSYIESLRTLNQVSDLQSSVEIFAGLSVDNAVIDDSTIERRLVDL